ncbi:MAG: hypothetical protein AAB842_02545 [Patescibacteria group bacterium]
MKRIFAIPILILASFVAFLYAVLPQISTVSKAKENFLKTEKELNNRQKYFENLKSSLEEMAGYQDTLGKIDAALPGEIFFSSLIEFFNQKSNNNGLILKSVAPATAPVSEEGSINAQQGNMGQIGESPAQYFTLVLNGSITSFESFLKDIETSARLVDVESISLQQGLGEVSSNISILVKVYY